MQTLMQTMNMEIRGLGSEPTVRSVRSALECIRGVAQVRIVPNERYVTVTYDAFRVSPQQFKTAVRVMGCEVARLTIPTPHASAEQKIPDAAACAGAIVRSSDQRGQQMLPIKHAMESASTDAQVLRGLSSFLDHLRSCNIDSVLPQRFSGLSACNADEIQAWSAKLEQGGKDIYSLTAAGRLWFEEVREAFAKAAQRLDEIAEAKQLSAPGVRILRPVAGNPAERA